MALKYGKREIETMIAALEGDYETVVQAAEAALAAAEGIFEKRAQFVVVGQMSGNKDRRSIPPSDPEAIKLCLDWFSTKGDALKAAESLAYSSVTQDTFRTWVLPMHHQSTTELSAKQKEKYAELEAAREVEALEKFQENIRKRQEAMEERARGGKGSCEHCGHQPFDHSMTSPGGKGRGKCWLTDCTCTKWKEKTK